MPWKSISWHHYDVIMTSQNDVFRISNSLKYAFFNAIFRHEASKMGQNVHSSIERKFNVLSKAVVKKFRDPRHYGDFCDCLKHVFRKKSQKIGKTVNLNVRELGHPRTSSLDMFSEIVLNLLIIWFQAISIIFWPIYDVIIEPT